MKIKANPNRMMLIRLRRRLDLARRGHRLLKNKQEKLMQIFIGLVRETMELRVRVDRDLLDIAAHYLDARAGSAAHALEDALSLTCEPLKLSVGARNEMGVSSPVFRFDTAEEDPAYRLEGTSAELDFTYRRLRSTLGELLDLVGKEAALFRMADELEKTRRRVNALEYILIPGLESTIREIADKLSENERANQVRMMKIKAMVEERSRYS